MTQRFKWRTQNNLEEEQLVGDYAATVNDEPSQTKQEPTADADINVIMKRYGVTDKAIPPQAFPEGVPTVDLTAYAGMDLRDAMDQIRAAENAFRELPADIRSRFNNRAEEMWSFVNNPRNDREAIEMGLLRKREEPKPPEPQLVRIVADPGTTGATAATTASGSSPTPAGPSPSAQPR